MRASACFWTMGLVLAVWVGSLRAGDTKTVSADRIAELICQLGHDEYLQREAADRELDAIGEPALSALRAALASSDDPEIRYRVRELIPSIADRAANEDLKKLQGTWTLVSREESGKKVASQDKTHTLTVTDNLWLRKHGDVVIQQGNCMFVDTAGQPRRVNMMPVGGGIAHGICQVEGNTLRYCCHDSPDARPQDFTTKEGDGRFNEVWKRAKP